MDEAAEITDEQPESRDEVILAELSDAQRRLQEIIEHAERVVARAQEFRPS